MDTAALRSERTGTSEIDRLIDEAREALLAVQREDGHWIFEFEADATIPAEYIFLQHYLDEIDQGEEDKIGVYLRRIQNDEGGWPLFPEGESDLSATVKAYYALKMIGDEPDEDHMVRARKLILSRGGAARANVFTRFSLALFGQVPWRAVPVMPVEIMLLPGWFPFHLSKVSYWSRTVIVPLLILAALKPRARNPRGVDIRELFVTPPEEERTYVVNPTGTRLGDAFVLLDRALRLVEPRFRKSRRERAIKAAVEFMKPRLNGDDGLGGIFPAMANAVMAMDALGFEADDPDFATAKAAVRKLMIHRDDEAYCQPCLSPIWDSALAMHALMEAGGERVESALADAVDWLLEREIRDVAGDWRSRRPDLAPGGWAFQYRNDYYPDVDDTAVVGMALHRLDEQRYAEPIERTKRWIIGMQSSDGGWGAFDPENTHTYLNAIPFADHGALLDPPTVDVTARCVSFLAQIGCRRDEPVMARALDYLRREQETDGSWYGRWGVNYVYGTWSALSAFNAVGEDPAAPHIRRAVAFLESRQLDDGGWGEDCGTYWEDRRDVVKASTPSQTAWALLGLMAAGETDSEAVRCGIAYLEDMPRDGPYWRESLYTGIGFPRVFYLKYYGYSAYFPLWAVARYRNMRAANQTRVAWGM